MDSTNNCIYSLPFTNITHVILFCLTYLFLDVVSSDCSTYSQIMQFYTGSLKHHLSEWKNIGASQFVLDCISEGVKFSFKGIPPLFSFDNHSLTFSQARFVDKEILALTLSGAIKKVNCAPKCVSPIGCVPKKGNKWRLITDLRAINQYIEAPKFQYEGISYLKNIVKPDDQFITWDLNSGFHHVEIHPSLQTYLGIKWRNKYYVWTVLPFGLNVSPYFFSKITRAVITYLRSVGLRVASYVDDGCLAAQYCDMDTHKSLLLNTLDSLGFFVNKEKSSLIPEFQKEFLGFVLTSKGKSGYPEILIPKQKLRKLGHDLSRLLKKSRIEARTLAKIAGVCVSMTSAVLPGKLMLRSVYRLLKTKTSWSDVLYLNDSVKADLLWWKTSVKQWNGTVLIPSPVQAQIFTDASHIAWGGVLNNSYAQGFWPPHISHKSSNIRELLTVRLVLESFINQVSDKHVQVVSDNITTIAYLNHLGGPCVELNNIAAGIWELALEHNILLSAKHIQGKLNYIPDKLSRLNPIYEWQLNPGMFRLLDTLWGPHDIDRFATMANTQLPVYNSRFLDPYTTGVDGLAQQDWEHLNNFVNPPFRLLDQVLQVIIQQRAEATVIAPAWRGHMWFQKLKALSVVPPIPLPNKRQTFLNGTVAEPLRNLKWKIFAWRVNGKKNC